jgi:predicted enzyme related to lactoylglutathione lyase
MSSEPEPEPDAVAPLGPIVQVLIPVADLDRAVTFYAEVLGFPVSMRFPGAAFLDAHGVRLYLSLPETPDFDGRSTVYFRAPGLAAVVDGIRARGGRIRQEPHVVHRDGVHELWLAFVDDPEGNHVGLMDEVPIAPGDA